MTSLDGNSFDIASIGPQKQSQRRGAPVVGFSKVGRDQRAKMFISHEHSRAGALGRQSPVGGAIYEIPSTLNLKTGVSFGAGPAAGAGFLNVRAEDGIPTNDELGILVDSQQFKYGRDSSMIIGTEPRGRLKDAELIKNHSAAFFGKDSPGPAAIGETYGPNYEMTKPKLAKGIIPFCGKWKPQKESSQPPNVGPGLYPRKDIAVGPQKLSHRRNQPCNEFGKAPKFEKTRSAGDSISVLDSAKTSLGKQVLSKNRSEGALIFSTCGRDRRARTALCITDDDLGPKAFLPKPFHSMPTLPKEREIMTTGWNGVGMG